MHLCTDHPPGEQPDASPHRLGVLIIILVVIVGTVMPIGNLIAIGGLLTAAAGVLAIKL